MKRLYLIRGLPGSGKSTLAAEISPNVFEADQFFYTKGKYQYEGDKIADAHKWCQKSVKHAMNYGADKIVVSNTFVKRWELEAYYELAAQYDYRVTEITMSGELHQNIHNVPFEVIARMKESWEK